MTIRVEIIRTEDTPATLRDVIAQRYREVFPNVGDDGIDESGNAWQVGAWRVLVYRDAVWGAIAEIQARDILVGGQAVRVAGVGGVMSLPEVRGTGLGKVVMAETTRHIREDMRPDAGMLFCAPENVAFYDQFGWQNINRLIHHQPPTGARVMDATTDEDNIMILPCGEFVFPAGDIDVQGYLW